MTPDQYARWVVLTTTKVEMEEALSIHERSMGFGIMTDIAKTHERETGCAVGSLDQEGRPDGLAIVVENFPADMYGEDDRAADFVDVVPEGLKARQGFRPASVLGIYSHEDPWNLADLYAASVGLLTLSEFGGVIVAQYRPQDMFYTLDSGWVSY